MIHDPNNTPKHDVSAANIITNATLSNISLAVSKSYSTPKLLWYVYVYEKNSMVPEGMSDCRQV